MVAETLFGSAKTHFKNQSAIVLVSYSMGDTLIKWSVCAISTIYWTASSEFGTYRLCEQRRFRRACASAQSRQNLRCSLIQAVNQEELSDRKPDPWPLWMAGHAQLKFVMTECSKTQIRLTGLYYLTNSSADMLFIACHAVTRVRMPHLFYVLRQSYCKRRWILLLLLTW